MKDKVDSFKTAVSISMLVVALPIAWSMVVFAVNLQNLPDKMDKLTVRMDQLEQQTDHMDKNVALIALAEGVKISVTLPEHTPQPAPRPVVLYHDAIPPEREELVATRLIPMFK